MAPEVASAIVTLIPSARGFKRRTERELDPPMRQVAREQGRSFGQIFTDQVKRSMARNLIPSISTVVAGLGPALVPALAGITVATGALGSAFVAAGAGAAAFGAVAIPMFTHVTEAQKKFTAAREAYDRATTRAGREAALRREQQALAGLTPAEQGLARALDRVKAAWQATVKPLQSVVAVAIQPWLDAVVEAMKFVEPLVRPAAAAITFLGQQAKLALGSPFWKDFFTELGQFGQFAITGFGAAVGNLARGFAGLVRAFIPIARQVLPGLVQLTRRFAGFATGLSQSSGFQKFIDYVTANGPRLLSILGNVVVIVGKLLVGLAPLGAALLGVLGPLTSFLAKLSPPVLLAIGAAIAAVVAPIPTLIAGIVALAAVVVRNWSKIKAFTVSAWNKIKGFVASAASAVKNAVIGAWNRAKNATSSAISTVVGFVRRLPGRIRSALGNLGRLLVNAGKSVIQGLINGIKSKIAAIGHIMSSVAGKIRGFLPFSPAKEGPLSGRGSPEVAGAKIGAMLADGLRGQRATVAHAASVVAGAASVTGAAGLAASGAGVGTAAGVPVRIVLDVTGTDEDMKRLIRKMVRVQGRGNVQAAFGR